MDAADAVDAEESTREGEPPVYLTLAPPEGTAAAGARGEEAADEDDPFQTGRGVGARGTRAAAEGDAPQDWETFEGSKYYRE